VFPYLLGLPATYFALHVTSMYSSSDLTLHPYISWYHVLSSSTWAISEFMILISHTTPTSTIILQKKKWTRNLLYGTIVIELSCMRALLQWDNILEQNYIMEHVYIIHGPYLTLDLSPSHAGQHIGQCISNIHGACHKDVLAKQQF